MLSRGPGQARAASMDAQASDEARGEAPFFHVKTTDMKPIRKTLKGGPALALELYARGNGDT